MFVEPPSPKRMSNSNLRVSVFFVMLFTMNPDMLFLHQQASQMNIPLQEEQLRRFDLYQSELLQWNAKMSLISEKSSRDVVTRHFLDSLIAYPFLPKAGCRLLDIGSGAGFPGVPLKIARPDLELYLVEANRKKSSFLKHLIRLLNLSAVYVIHERIENLIRNISYEKNLTLSFPAPPIRCLNSCACVIFFSPQTVI